MLINKKKIIKNYRYGGLKNRAVIYVKAGVCLAATALNQRVLFLLYLPGLSLLSCIFISRKGVTPQDKKFEFISSCLLYYIKSQLNTYIYIQLLLFSSYISLFFYPSKHLLLSGFNGIGHLLMDGLSLVINLVGPHTKWLQH